MKRRNKKPTKMLALGLSLALAVTSLTGCDSLTEQEPEYDIVGTSHGMYAYETLTEEEQRVYDEMTYAIENRLESIRISTTDEELMDRVHWAVYYDHCEYFWSETYKYMIYTNRKDEVTKLEFIPVYTMDAEAQENCQQQIDAAVEEILAKAPVDGSDYDKAMYVYQTLIEDTDYVLDAPNNQNIISIFLNQETVCLGYAYGAHYLLNQLEIPCTTVYGTSENETHSWNLIRLDGDYYYMDVTWGEVSYWEDVNDVPPEESVDGQPIDDPDLTAIAENSEMINYCHFGVSDGDGAFMAEHRAYEYVPMPVCTATENNYFVHEGLYFETWDRSLVGEKIQTAYDEGEDGILLKFSSKEVYDEAFDDLIEDGNWYRYCDLNSIVYVDQFEKNVLMLEFPRKE